MPPHRRLATTVLATLRALHPPPELQAAHRRLLADSATDPKGAVSQSNLGPVIARERRIAADLSALGLARCAAAARTSIAELEQASARLRHR